MERYNVVVIGAGSGGLVVAAGAAGLGARAALVEKHAMGGDCLNYGCVPSKALLRAAKAVQQARDASRFGIRGIADPGVQDARAVMEYVRSCQAHIAPHDSVERFTGLGVDVVLGAGRFSRPREVEVEVEGSRRTLWGRHVVIATGSRARIPEVPGLAEAGFLTNETIFDVVELPRHLLVVGGGPIGVELGQAFRRLGSQVTIVSSSTHVCPREDADAAAVLAERLRGEGVAVLDEARAERVELREGRKAVSVRSKRDGSVRDIACDAILVAAGRVPNVEGLNLEAAGVAYDAAGVRIDASCRTSVRSIWAVGDVAGSHLFTHWAGHQARVVIRNVLFPGSSACDSGNLPRVTYTDPEIAHVGLTEDAAGAAPGGVPHTTLTVPFSSNDRAVCDGEHEGYFAKVFADRKGRILGATIVHPHAGDLIAEIVLAKRHGISLAKLSEAIHAYPTLAEINRSLGDAYRRTSLTPGMKSRLAKVYAWLRR